MRIDFRIIIIELMGAMLLLGLQSGNSVAAEIEVVDGRYAGERYVRIRGPVTAGDAENVVRAARIALREGNNRLALLLDSPGGDVVEAMKIGTFARELLATTYVYGNVIYTPGTPAGDELERSGQELSQARFGLKAIGRSSQLEDQDLVRCHSACVLIFYGGVRRYASDNVDYRNGFQRGQSIAVIGIHRPYYDQEHYSALSPSEARDEYRSLENLVRAYMLEMGAPVYVIDRMFRSSSDEMDLVPSDEFREFYQATEPFFDEWLIAQCRGDSLISTSEYRDYDAYRQLLNQLIGEGKINSLEDYNAVVPEGMTRQHIEEILEKLNEHARDNMQCRESAILEYQREWARSAP